MNRKIKSFVTLCILAVVALCVSCQQKSKIQLMVEDAQKQCPIDMGVIGKVSSVTYENGELVMELCMNEEVFNLDMISADKEAAKRSALNSMATQTDDLKGLLDEVIKEKASFVYRYVGEKSKKLVEVRLTYEELQKALNTTPEDVDYEAEFRSQMEAANAQCPYQSSATTVLDSVTVNDDYLVYNYTIDEDNMDMNGMIENPDEVKATLAESLRMNMSAMRMFALSCVETNHGISYHYIGNKSGREFSIDFTIANIRELMGNEK